MFIGSNCKHPHFESACSRFKSNHEISEIAPSAGIDAQVLRNKLNPDQPHHMTVADLISLYHATDGDETLIDGMLLECGLTAIAIPRTDRASSLPHQAIRLNADVANIGMRAVELADRGRVTRTERNTIVSVATSAMGSLALLIHDIEARFQAVPTLACASDILMQAATM